MDYTKQQVCRNCKFWGESTDNYPLPNDEKEYETWLSCHKMAANCVNPIYPPTLAFAFETGENDSQVLTAPNFGCNMFESVSK